MKPIASSLCLCTNYRLSINVVKKHAPTHARELGSRSSLLIEALGNQNKVFYEKEHIFCSPWGTWAERRNNEWTFEYWWVHWIPCRLYTSCMYYTVSSCQKTCPQPPTAFQVSAAMVHLLFTFSICIVYLKPKRNRHQRRNYQQSTTTKVKTKDVLTFPISHLMILRSMQTTYLDSTRWCEWCAIYAFDYQVKIFVFELVCVMLENGLLYAMMPLRCPGMNRQGKSGLESFLFVSY